jgi:hypothetical protein
MTDRLSSYAELAEILEILPVLLREGRRSRRLTLRAASEQTGVGFNTILRVENGNECSVTNAIRILRWLHLPAALDGEGTDHGC